MNHTTTRLIHLGFAAAPVLALCAIGMVLLYVGVLYPDFNWRLIDRIHVDLDAAAALFFIAAAAYAGSAWGTRARVPMFFDCEELDLETIERIAQPGPLYSRPNANTVTCSTPSERI